MSPPKPTVQPTDEAGASKKVADLSGQSRLGRNLAFAWGGYLVNVVAGFVLPRLISDRLGQTTLGIWDFAWSVVSYFALAQLNVSGSVQRYVARYRAISDHKGLSKSVSTIGLSLKVSGALVVLISLAVSHWVIPQFRDKLGDQVDVAGYVVLLLGLEVAASLMLTVYGGILVGCHRWDMQNLISAICYLVMTIGMILAILAGGGLIALAGIHCVTMTAGELIRWKLARRVCPEYVMDFRLANWSTWKEQAYFSAKSLLPRVADLVSNQFLALLMTFFLGPAMLAIYSRPRNLMRQCQTIAAKFGAILIPTASSLQAQADHLQLQEIFLKSSRFISILTMPAVAGFVIFGNELIRLWMGSAYVYDGLIAILAIGCFPALVQEPVWCILAGMNTHGKLAFWKLAAAFSSAAILGAGLGFLHWQLLGAALAFALPQMMVELLVAPLLACRLLHVRATEYYLSTYLKPLIGASPFICCLAVARITFRSTPIVGLLFGALAALFLGIVYLIAFQDLREKRAKDFRYFPNPWKKRLNPVS